MTEENFINEKRFALAFANDKFRFNKWGKIKIKYELQKKNIPQDFINYALTQINDAEYKRTARKLIIEKIKSLRKKENDKYKIKLKLIRFLLSKGYENSLIEELSDKILKI